MKKTMFTEFWGAFCLLMILIVLLTTSFSIGLSGFALAEGHVSIFEYWGTLWDLFTNNFDSSMQEEVLGLFIACGICWLLGFLAIIDLVTGIVLSLLGGIGTFLEKAIFKKNQSASAPITASLFSPLLVWLSIVIFVFTLNSSLSGDGSIKAEVVYHSGFNPLITFIVGIVIYYVGRFIIDRFVKDPPVSISESPDNNSEQS